MNIGDYVRLKSYGIKKIIGFSSTLEEDFIECDYDKYQKVLINKKEVIKSNPNIIDLIEENDYVKLDDRSNIKYWRIVKGPTNKLMIEDDGWNELDDLEDEEITGIITCEQMKNMEYKVGD